MSIFSYEIRVDGTLSVLKRTVIVSMKEINFNPFSLDILYWSYGVNGDLSIVSVLIFVRKNWWSIERRY